MVQEDNRLKYDLITSFKANISKLIEKNQISEASSFLEEYRKLNTGDYEIISMLSVISILKGNFEEAEAILQDAIKNGLFSFDLFFNLGYIYEQKCLNELSLEYYSKALAVARDITIKNELGIKVQSLISEYNLEKKQLDLNKLNRIKKILFVQAIADIRTNKIAQIISDYGIQVDLIYIDDYSMSAYKDLKLPYKNMIKIYTVGDAVSFVNRSDYDLIFSCNEPDYLSALFAKCSNKPIIHDCHDMMSLRSSISNEEMIHEYIANTQCNGNVYVTKFVYDIAVTNFSIEDKNVMILDNYVMKSQIPSRMLEKLSSFDGELHCVYEGGLRNIEGHHRNIEEIFLKLAENKIHVHFYAQNNNNYYEELNKKSSYIHYEGEVGPDKLIEEMTKYDVGLAVLNITEKNKNFLDTTFPNKAWEYLAAGLPILFSDLVSFRDFLKENKVGEIIENNFNLANQVKRIAEMNIDKDFILKNKFTMDSQADKIIAFFNSVANKDKKLITVIIPTKNRSIELKECMTYFKNLISREIGINLVILDSSDDKYQSINERNAKEISESFNNLMYINFESNFIWWEKVWNGIKNTYTEYCLICADDDFYTKSGIIESIKVLENREEVSTVLGKTKGFINKDRTAMFIREIDTPNNIVESKVEKRLEKLVSRRIVQSVYSMHRTHELFLIVDFMLSSPDFYKLNHVFQEYLFYFLKAIKGSTIAIDTVTNIRNQSKNSTTHNIENFPDMINKDKFNDKYALFCKIIIEFVNIHFNSNAVAYEDLDDIFADFLINSLGVESSQFRIKEGKLEIL